MPSSSPDHQAGLGAAILCMSRGFRGRLVPDKAGWGFSLAHRPCWRGKKKKEKDQISVPLNCPGFVQPTNGHCETVL